MDIKRQAGRTEDRGQAYNSGDAEVAIDEAVYPFQIAAWFLERARALLCRKRNRSTLTLVLLVVALLLGLGVALLLSSAVTRGLAQLTQIAGERGCWQPDGSDAGDKDG